MRGRFIVGAVVLTLAGAGPYAASGAASGVAAKRTEHGFVTSSVTLPLDATQARSLGRDLTGDGRSDNALARVFAALVDQGLDLTQAWNADIRGGSIVMLQSVRTRSLATDRDATWQLRYGVPHPDPDLTGTGTFAAGSTHSARVPAKIVDHHLKTSATTIPIRMDLGGGPFTMPLVVGRAFATCSTQCSGGRINGAFRSTKVDSVLVPRLAQLLQELVDRDCVGPTPDTCVAQSAGATVEQIFDTDPQDLIITADEVRNNSLIKALLAPDVDLYKADGTRGKDGKRDSLSFGFGFRAVKAKILH